MSAKIAKILIEVGGKKIELSLEEAKELMNILDSTFGQKDVITIPSPYPVPYVPYLPYHQGPWYVSSSWSTATKADGVVTLRATDSGSNHVTFRA